MQDFLSLGPGERADYDAFVARVRLRAGIDLGGYREHQMFRRLRALVEHARLSSFAAYADLLERDPAEMAAFLDRVTINVSELFRNPEMWNNLRGKVLPPMLSAGRTLKIWSAGCSTGAEPYTLAIILAEMGEAGRHRLLATDIDARVLSRASAGIFSEAEVRSVPAELRARYVRTRADGQYDIADGIKRQVEFRRHDLLRDPFPEDLDLIVCRNVVIYFTDNAKDELFRRFAEALRPGGVLFVGGTERVNHFRELGFISPLPFFYQRPECSGMMPGEARAAA